MKPLLLHSFHQAAGARFAQIRGTETVARFRTEAEEELATRSSVGLVDLSFRELMRVTGEDRVAFLHGMLTQDIKGLVEGAGAYACLCTAKGALVTDAWVLRRPGEVWLDFEPGVSALAQAALERFLISEDAELQDLSDDWAQLGLLGPAGPQVLQALGGSWPGLGLTTEWELDGQRVVALGGKWGERDWARLWLPRAQLPELYQRVQTAGATPVGFEAAEVARVEAGVPRFGQDLQEGDIPLEAGVAHAISYTKGCYIGQETIARATYRGHMNRGLVGTLPGDAEAPVGAALCVGAKQVGELTSVVRSTARKAFLALGRVHRDFQQPGTRLEIPGHPGATVERAP